MIDYSNIDLIEKHLGNKVAIAGRTLGELIDEYESLLAELIIIKHKEAYPDSDTFLPKRLERAFNWLRSTDFYKAPASTIYHGSFEGGLLIHSLEVYNNILTLRTLPQFNDCSVASAALIALVHDWCKIDLYESYEKNVKNEETGQWEKQKAFRHNQKGVPLGHGTSSMFLAQRIFNNMSIDELLAIRWHMSSWYVSDSEKNELQLANENYPLVHLLQFADQLSITQYANNKLDII